MRLWCSIRRRSGPGSCVIDDTLPYIPAYVVPAARVALLEKLEALDIISPMNAIELHRLRSWLRDYERIQLACAGFRAHGFITMCRGVDVEWLEGLLTLTPRWEA